MVWQPQVDTEISILMSVENSFSQAHQNRYLEGAKPHHITATPKSKTKFLDPGLPGAARHERDEQPFATIQNFDYLCPMNTVIFDLGGVVVARNPEKTTEEFREFFSFLADKKMPLFWEEYDRGTQTIDETIDIIAQIKGLSHEKCRATVLDAVNMQEEIAPTARLIEELHSKGFRLLVLSNMSLEFIEFIRKLPVYKYFSGEVVSCEEHTVKPEAEIFKILLERYNVEPSDALFVDDRAANLEAAAAQGINTTLFKRWEAEQSCDAIRAMLY